MIRRTTIAAIILSGLLLNPAALGAQAVTGPLVVSSGWPECSNLQTWAKDIWRIEGLEAAGDTRRAIALYNWLRLFNRNAVGGMTHAAEGPPGEEQYLTDAHKHLFVYGWGYCDTHSRIMEALWREYKQDSTAAYRVCCRSHTGGYHTMYRLLLDGAYGAFDARFAFYLLDRDSPDARVLDWREVGRDENVIRNEKFVNRQPIYWENPGKHRPYILRIKEAFWNSEAEWASAGRPIYEMFASPMYNMGTAYHDMNWRLPRGTTLERFWDNSARKFYRPLSPDGSGKPRFLPSGRFHWQSEARNDSAYSRLDPNFKRTAPYHLRVPTDEGYPDSIAGDKALGQAWGRLSYRAPLTGDGYLDALSRMTNFNHEAQAPYLRPAERRVAAEAVFDFYCPFIMVDGAFSVELAAEPGDRVSLELRTLNPKPGHRGQPDVWSEWLMLAEGPGAFEAALGHQQYRARQVTVHGKYRFQLRLKAYAAGSPAGVGLKALAFNCHFETGIMSIPQIFAGENEITFKVADRQAVKAPVEIVYNYQTPGGPRTHIHTIRPGDFSGNLAAYKVPAPGLLRCNSLVIKY